MKDKRGNPMEVIRLKVQYLVSPNLFLTQIGAIDMANISLNKYSFDVDETVAFEWTVESQSEVTFIGWMSLKPQLFSTLLR